MKILYIAYSCSPIHGSEDAIGWNIPVESAKENTVYVITKEEQRKYIEDYAAKRDLRNIRFFYVDIPKVYKKIFSGPFYSGRLNIWHRKAEKLAEALCRREKIEIIHQITPIEFRSIGNYGKIPDVKFVCGPLGGGEFIPKGLRPYAASCKPVETIRYFLNEWYRITYRIANKLGTCDCTLFANRETGEYLSGEINNLTTEIGIGDISLQTEDRSWGVSGCRFLVSGRLVYRKGHQFLIDALRRIPETLAWECIIVGDGPEKEKLQRMCRDTGLLERIIFLGNVSYAQMQGIYHSADVLVVPSLRETTGTVILEALAKGLPVVTINKFGATTILDDSCGWLYEGDNQESFIENLKTALVECIQDPDEVRRKGESARCRAENFTWEKKNQYYQSVYCRLLGRKTPTCTEKI